MIFSSVIACVILLIIIIILNIMVAPGRIPPEAMRSAGTFFGLNCAHRGLYTADQSIPENSMAAFIAARDKGYGIELDVHLTAEGQVVVFHDYELKRACGVEGRIDTTSYSALLELRLFGTGERIPLLAEVLSILGDTPVIVELKPSGTRNNLLSKKTLEILQTFGKNWCIQSFDPRICEWFKRNAPYVFRGQLSCPPREYAGISKMSSLVIGNLLLNFKSRPHYIAYKNNPYPLIARLCMHKKPMKAVWTINTEDDSSKAEKDNDFVIFEHYKPKPRYK